MKTIVIPAAGLGSRLGEYTHNYNKAMCTLGPKPVISYIIEKFEKNDEIIILLGYKGDLLKQVINMCYPDWNISFINVDIYEGEGSGLGYSLSCAKDKLQKPFIFWSNDTLIDEDINKFDYTTNWAMVSEFDINNAFSYRHAKTNIENSNILSILPKGEFDESGKTTFPYIGISFIKDYEDFWAVSESNDGFEIFRKVGESYGLNSLNNLKCYFTKTWIDTGNKLIFEKYKKIYNQRMEQTILEKPKEAIWFFDDKVVKFHLDKKFIIDRVKRAKSLINSNMLKAGFIVPTILDYSDNIYVMNNCDGIVLSKIINNKLFYELIHNFFSNVEEYKFKSSKEEDKEKINMYKTFYYDKTLKRINEYCTYFEDIDSDDIIINGLKCKSATKLLKAIDWDNLAKKYCKVSLNFHGDFHLENILYNEQSKKFILLDWRQNFGSNTSDFYGDLYYDIAKMWHSLIVNHNMVKQDLFSIKYLGEKEFEIDIHRTFIDTECERVFKEWLSSKNSTYDFIFSQFMTSIIFLNIAACHVAPYSKFLFLLGKYLLNSLVQDKKDFYKEICL